MGESHEPAEDFRSERMPSPDGKGKARAAWDAYVAAVGKVAETPPVEDGDRTLRGVDGRGDLFGFWLWWQLEGGFEGLRRAGME